MLYNFCIILADLVRETLDEINEALSYSFYYEIALGEIPFIAAEGEYALPIRSEGLWDDFLRAIDMTQAEFTQEVHDRIEYDFARSCR